MWPTPTSGTNSSHTPEEPISRIGWIRPSQSLKSPMTRTALARGAHTANDTPRTLPIGPSYSCSRAPEHGPQLLVAALVDQVQVDLAERGGEPVGVVLEVLDAVGPRDEQAVVHRARGVGAHRGPHALGLVRELELLAVLEPHPHRLGERLEHPQPQAAGLEVLAEEVVRLLVASLDEGGDRAADLGAGRGGHDGSPCVVGCCEKWAVRRRTAPSGMATQPGRLRAS